MYWYKFVSRRGREKFRYWSKSGKNEQEVIIIFIDLCISWGKADLKQTILVPYFV